MHIRKCFREAKQIVACVLSIAIIGLSVLPHISVSAWEGISKKDPGATAIASEDLLAYCIDGFGVSSNGYLMRGDKYRYVLPSTGLSNMEKAYLFWSMLSLQANFGTIPEVNKIFDQINARASGEGLSRVQRHVTEEDLKTVIHSSATRNKYSWLNDAVTHAQKYMEMGGILGAPSAVSGTGKAIPAVLQGKTSLLAALPVDGNTFTIEFDSGGADKDFIHQVPLKFSADGSDDSWDPAPFGGWVYEKTDTAIKFTNPNPAPPKLLILFDTAGTEYAAGGKYQSVDEVYEQGLQLWVCVECANNHPHTGGPLALHQHQRLVFVDLDFGLQQYYAAINTPALQSQKGGLEFNVYRHQEEMTSTYNLQGYKYDHETGKPLEGAVFELFERFDDQAQINTERDGHVQIYEGGKPYQSFHSDNPAVWDGFKFVSSLRTDENGYMSKAVNRSYHYDKTFCDGHPAPVFISLPEPQTDPESGQVLNEDEIAAAQGENQRLAREWLDCAAACADHASGEFEGVHFHWIMNEVNVSLLEAAAAGGSEAPLDAGPHVSASGEEAYQLSGCQADCEATYQKFISLNYSYALREAQARPGYTLHGQHNDDVPMEVITTDASENGANSSFAGIYGKDIQISRTLTSRIKAGTDVLAERKLAKAYQLMGGNSLVQAAQQEQQELSVLTQPKQSYLQKILEFFQPEQESDEGEHEGERGGANHSTPANAGAAFQDGSALASVSNAGKRSRQSASPPDAKPAGFQFGAPLFEASAGPQGETEGSLGQRFIQAYNEGLNKASSGPQLKPGVSGNYSHSNHADHEKNAWRIYDHRTEGELHVNKRDLELAGGAGAGDEAYGDSQGDATLEGAVYGLFARTDIIHPDGKTGVVYQAGNLVAVAATDKNGDASFMANTEAPGHFYHFRDGKIMPAAGGWADQAPENLYRADITYDDYPAGGQYRRQYYDNKQDNGNSWIGRPLLMGSYYIQELTRSEGYELSIANKDNELTNKGQQYELSAAAGRGSVFISKPLYPEGQISANPTGKYGEGDTDELFFQVQSKDTPQGFDLLFNYLPQGIKLYRRDTGTKSEQVVVGTGEYEKVYLSRPDGSPEYVTVQHDHQYPRYHPDGSLMTQEIAVTIRPEPFPCVRTNSLNPELVQQALQSAEPGMDEGMVLAKLGQPFTAADFDFLKGKTEKALRSNKKNTPGIVSQGSGTSDVIYSDIYTGIYDQGIRQGETDPQGISGAAPGGPAVKTVYGSPVREVAVAKVNSSANPVTAGDAALSLLDFYHTHSFYNYGGIHSMTETAEAFVFTVYAGIYGNPADFSVRAGAAGADSIIYHRLEYLPADTSISPRYEYVAYTSHPDANAFGTYTDYQEQIVGNTWFCTATLITDAKVLDDGTIASATVTQNVYYQPGETPLDRDGIPIRAFEIREKTQTKEQTVEDNRWVELMIEQTGQKQTAHVDSTYRDTFGQDHEDSSGAVYDFRLVLPQKKITLTRDDLDLLAGNTDWAVGMDVSAAEYYLAVWRANVSAWTDYLGLNWDGENSYIEPAELVYPGQDYPWQDGSRIPGSRENTREKPIRLAQRVIKQQIKVVKQIDQKSSHYTDPSSGQRSAKPDNFRFKAYLKSNLERLYRDEAGQVVWLDRTGREVDAAQENQRFPGLVNKLFTKAPHRLAPLYHDSADGIISNDKLYGYTGGYINDHQNSGYSAVLETIEVLAEDGAGTRTITAWNYDKFFAALAVAGGDKWDGPGPGYTSWQPIGNEANRTGHTIDNARVSDRVRQFAIDWYLEEEIKKLQQRGLDHPAAYADELYDQALRYAILKAENYLKPFFAYDLDHIYAVHWDSEAGGGRDGDTTTLSANQYAGAQNQASEYCFETSLYLPYGVYVVVEQQPRESIPGDLANRHYQTDAPKEVVVPAVYADGAEAGAGPAALSSYYHYQSDMSREEMEQKFRIRFGEEDHVIKAHSHAGDFQIYKYGLDIDLISNDVPAVTEAGDYFALTQSEFSPYKNYYNREDNRLAGAVRYYLAEGLAGWEEIAKHYRYSSLSENTATANDVAFTGAPVTADNLQGIYYQDNVAAVSGVLTAYHGQYAPMLIPYTVTAPNQAGIPETAPENDGESTYTGYSCTQFTNRLYGAKLRIEKRDSETHENILHDGALFRIYAAKRHTAEDGKGTVMFYEQDTLITGTKEFLAAMGAKNIQPFNRRQNFFQRLFGPKAGPGQMYSGVVPAGTPVCDEEQLVILGDDRGDQTVAFKACTTVLDGMMEGRESADPPSRQNQTVGYLELPQALAAGVYVLAEIKPTAGYARSRPVAIELYSDKVAYYKEGSRDNRVIAALYEYPVKYPSANQNKPWDRVDTARISVENAPVKLAVSKTKPTGEVTFKISGRIEGSLTEIGNNPDLIYAWDNGTYLGYAYRKGTLEKLTALKDAGEQVEIVFDGSNFAGYGYVTRKRETQDDANPYVAGAVMTLFDAIALTPSGDTQDHAFSGLNIRRTDTNNIQQMYIEQGYAGEKIEFIKEPDDSAAASGYIWNAKTVMRPDTDILYYDLDSLSVTWREAADGREILYGWDKNHTKTALEQLEADKAGNAGQSAQSDLSIYAFKGGQAFLEFTGGDFTKISYDRTNKSLTGDFAAFVRDDQGNWKLGPGTRVYHLDRNQNRDAMVDPYTGMAYVIRAVANQDGAHIADQVLVWPVKVYRDEKENIIGRDKIKTFRPATLAENQKGEEEYAVIEVINHSGQAVPDHEKPFYRHGESGYISGSWQAGAAGNSKPDEREQSHQESTLNQNHNGQNLNEEVLTGDNNGSFAKALNPVYDRYGLPYYYRKSNETYQQETALYDRNGDLVRVKESDHLDAYNQASYSISEAPWPGRKLYHRQGEGYILENTWTTSDKTPNDPFHDEETQGQPDLLKRVPVGHYIMEELIAPPGYVKGMPVGVTVAETADLQQTEMVDDTTKFWLEKLDAPGQRVVDVLDMGQKDRAGNYTVIGTSQEGSGRYGYGPIEGAVLALYPARYMPDPDHPEGYCLEKTSDQPFVFETTNSRAGAIEQVTAKWQTGPLPLYVEGLPKGYYILQEIKTPTDNGFVSAAPVNVYLTDDKEIQPLTVADDHTKVEVDKYVLDQGQKKPLSGAGFTLYPAELDQNGEIAVDAQGNLCYRDKQPIHQFTSNDASDYTASINLNDYPNGGGENRITGFMAEFEKLYAVYGVIGTGFGWSVERRATRPSAGANVWKLEDGKTIVVSETGITWPAGLSAENRQGFAAALNEAGRQTEIRWVINKTAVLSHLEKIDCSAAGGTADLFPAAATLIFTDSDGRRHRINVQKDSPANGFCYDYQFDYEKLPLVNPYASTYLTMEGYRRYDYLPAGAKMVLVETNVPEGYVKALPRAIEVEDREEVQRHCILNERNTLIIAKKIWDPSSRQESQNELAGVRLALYRADPQGQFTRTNEFLAADWTTGQDGVYTEADLINGAIPEGYAPGALKPHCLYDLPAGKYFLAETAALPYYTVMEPVEIDYAGGGTVQMIKVRNQPVTGELIIHKTDKAGSRLPGAVFELTAYEQGSRIKAVGFPIMLTEVNTILQAKELPVGKMEPDGRIIPYEYHLREVVPPEGYQANTEIYKFIFDGAGEYNRLPGLKVTVHEADIVNDETSFFFEKKDFDHLNDQGTDGMFLPGAVFALYRVTGTDDQGVLIYDEQEEADRWVSDGQAYELKGLAAGQTYVIVEKHPPAGYQLMKPVLFTISKDGRRIYNISNNSNSVTVNTIAWDDHLSAGAEPESRPDQDSIDSLTLKGRYAAGMEVAVVDEEGVEVLRFADTGGAHRLTAAAGLVEGKIYAFEEHTIYSDGSDEITNKVTRKVVFGPEGHLYQGRKTVHTTLTLSDQSGTVIDSFHPSEFSLEKSIKNNVSPENPRITMKNPNAAAGTGLEAGQPVINTISYANPANRVQDIVVTAVIDQAAEFLNPYDGTVNADTITWIIPQVKPLTGGQVSFVTELSDQAGYSVKLTASVTGQGLTMPATMQTTKEVPVLKPNMLTLHNELTGSGKTIFDHETSEYAVYLYDQRGNELAGKCRFTGNKKFGSLTSGDSIVLKGNEYITIDPDSYTGCTYRVVRKEDGKAVRSVNDRGGISLKTGSGCLFTRTMADTLERELFYRGGTYLLEETTLYSDGSSRSGNRYSFTLSDRAAINTIGGYNRETESWIYKLDITNGKELPGAHLVLRDKKGNILDEWISSHQPHKITGLKPGEEYVLTEVLAPEGYGKEEEITFTVTGDGTVNKVVMEDKPTHVVVSKKDITNQQELPGAAMKILELDPNGGPAKEVESWISGEQPHEIIGKLIAGKTYQLVEHRAPDGFVVSAEVVFTVSKDGRIDQVEMADDTTKVKIYKNEFATAANASAASGQAVAGALLQILNEDKTPALAVTDYGGWKTGERLVFTTAKAAKEVEKQLKAGAVYYLRELVPAPGYAYAEDVKFKAGEDGSIVLVEMLDKKTKLLIHKRDAQTGDYVPGAVLQIKDLQGEVLAEWISQEKAYELEGILNAGEEYILHEKQAPDGFGRFEDIRFRVSEHGEVDEITAVNSKTNVLIQKTDRAGRPLSGARFALYKADQQGNPAPAPENLITEWTTGGDGVYQEGESIPAGFAPGDYRAHEVKGQLTAGQTYYLYEQKAPAGYIRRQAPVPVKVNEIALGYPLLVVVENEKLPYDPPETPPNYYTLRIKKRDQQGQELPGAAFLVQTENKKACAVSTAASGTHFWVRLKGGQTVTIKETGAPEGYLGLEKEYTVVIDKNGKANLLNGDELFFQQAENSLVFVAVNRKEDLPPPVPKQPKQPKTGSITAFYERAGEVAGKDGKQQEDIPSTGVASALWQLLLLFGLSITGIIGCLKAKKKFPNQTMLWLLIFTFALLKPADVMAETGGIIYEEKKYQTDNPKDRRQIPEFMPEKEVGGVRYHLDSVEVYEEEKGENETAAAGPDGSKTISVSSEPFTGEPDRHTPKEQIIKAGETYYLSSFTVEELILDEREQEVMKPVLYKERAREEVIPRTAKVAVRDPVSGDEQEVDLPLTSQEWTSERWQEDFSFAAVVKDYDADQFMLGDKEILLDIDRPLQGYEPELLRLIGVPKENYRIKEICWEGETYLEQDSLCRRLRVLGSRKVADCHAVYSGMVNFPPVTAGIIHSVYESPAPNDQSDGDAGIYRMRAVASYVMVPAAPEDISPGYPMVTRVIAVSFLVFLLLGFLVRQKRKKQ